MNETVNIRNVIKLSGAFVACAIGSGFATGQEILQFFAGQGIMSIVGTLVTTVLFAWCGAMFMKHGFEHRLESPVKILEFYFGIKTGKYIETVFQIFLYGVYVIMIAGAGATLSEYFGINPMIGRVGMALFAFFTVILGLTRLGEILGGIGTVIILFTLAVGVWSFMSNFDGIAAASDIIPTLEITKAPGGWLGSAIIYPAYNAIVVIILSCSLGRNAKSGKEAMYGGLLGGILFGASILVMNLGIIAHIKEIYAKQVPTLELVSSISPVLATLFAVIICFGIYTTTVPMLWGCVRHFAEDGTKKFFVAALVLTALGLVLGMTNFRTLINIIYPASGYAGLALFAAVAYQDYKHRKSIRGLSEANAVKMIATIARIENGNSDI